MQFLLAYNRIEDSKTLLRYRINQKWHIKTTHKIRKSDKALDFVFFHLLLLLAT